MDIEKLIYKLTNAPGVSGTEHDTAVVLVDELKKYCDVAEINNRGSVVGELYGEGPHILIDAHMDRIGLIVTGIADNGFIRFDKCGSIDKRVLAGMEVTIFGREPVFGVISSVPPHLAKAEDLGKAKDFSELAIDTGLSREKCEELIALGDRFQLKSYNVKLMGNEISSSALDDRCGVASLLRVMEIVKESPRKPHVSVSFSVGEEVGGRGCATAAFDKDIDMAIAVDVSFAFSPGCKREETSNLGKGPMIGISPVLSYEMSNELKAIAEKNGIPYQMEIMNGGTSTHADELSILKSGIKTGLVSIPLKYMHTPCEVIDLTDIENTAKLISAFILGMEDEK